VHFLHVRSPEPDALPLIITHGWPGSVAEFMDVIGPLTDPRAHGAQGAQAFHVVAPSMPGYGFSGPTAEPGWNLDRIARAWAELMHRLGYDRYGAQGGDWGSGVSRTLGILEPEHVVGVHVNFLPVRPTGDRSELSESDQGRLRKNKNFLGAGSGYSALQSTRPQTVAYALTDSPVGQLAWIAEKFVAWTDPASTPTPDQILTDVMIYWLTATAGSSARLYWESPGAFPQGAVTPTGVAVFPHDVVLPIRSIAEASINIKRWTEFELGGHFAAMEQPELLVGDVRAFFGQLQAG
jgi:pimeloyl-ACP methyl ester carboxylesterase